MTTPTRKIPHLLVVGALHIDELATIKGAHVPHASNPVSWHSQAGGVAGNAARAAASVYQHIEEGVVTLQTAVGSDTIGDTLVNALHSDVLKVMPCVIDGESTGRYSAIISQEGELVIGLADVQLAEQLAPSPAIACIESNCISSVLLDANLSSECIQTLVNAARAASIPVTALSVSPAKATRLAACASSIDLLFCNRLEAFALACQSGRFSNTQTAFDVNLQTLSAALTDSGFSNLVISDGASDVLVSETGHCTSLPIAPLSVTANVNGAGDCLAGASVAALSAGKPLLQAVAEYGLDMAAQVINGERTPVSL